LKVAKLTIGVPVGKAKANHFAMARIKAAHSPRWHLPPLKIKRFISVAAKSPLTNLFAMGHTANCKRELMLE
jgi:hypothetical protein